MRKLTLLLLFFGITGIGWSQCGANGRVIKNPFGPGLACTGYFGGTPGGTNGQIQYNNAGAFGGLAPTGTGLAVLGTSPTITLPVLPFRTIGGTLPVAGTAGRTAWVDNGNAPGDCTAGGGSTINFCVDTGVTWISGTSAEYGVGLDGTLTLTGNLFSVTPGVFANMPATNGFIKRTSSSGTSSVAINRLIYGFSSGGVVPGQLSATGVTLTDTCTLSGWSILGSPAGSATVDVWKANAAIPTVANSITGGNYMTLSSGTVVQGGSVAGWTTTSGLPNDIFIFNIVTASTVTSLTITLYCTL